MSKMEATIGPIVTKLDSILNKIDDAKRIKMKKKEHFIKEMEICGKPSQKVSNQTIRYQIEILKRL